MRGRFESLRSLHFLPQIRFFLEIFTKRSSFWVALFQHMTVAEA